MLMNQKQPEKNSFLQKGVDSSLLQMGFWERLSLELVCVEETEEWPWSVVAVLYLWRHTSSSGFASILLCKLNVTHGLRIFLATA